ncbi:MAG: 1-acyl-sn-glycerol-3-phosphate acyltransferase [Chloroflexota bacterium]
MIDRQSWWCLRATAGLVAARRLALQTEGLQHLPTTGPVLFVCRHYHHLYDGCALLAVIPRPLQFVVGLDWVQRGGSRRLMELACRVAGWPVVLRPERLRDSVSAYRPEEVRPYVRSVLRTARSVLRTGGALVIFAEGYPIIEPHAIARPNDRSLLPFRPGFLHLIEFAQQGGQVPIPLIPIGLAYTPGSRWQVVVRLGAPLFHRERTQRAADLAAVEAAVRRLSRIES